MYINNIIGPYLHVPTLFMEDVGDKLRHYVEFMDTATYICGYTSLLHKPLVKSAYVHTYVVTVHYDDAKLLRTYRR